MLNCNVFDLSALTGVRGHKYKLYNQHTSVNAHRHFSVTKFLSFGMLYLTCLRCSLQIILDDCLIKLIYFSLHGCCDCISVLFFYFIFAFGIYEWLHVLYVRWLCSCLHDRIVYPVQTSAIVHKLCKFFMMPEIATSRISTARQHNGFIIFYIFV